MFHLKSINIIKILCNVTPPRSVKSQFCMARVKISATTHAVNNTVYLKVNCSNDNGAVIYREIKE